jgi:MarR-like DNA-binding transcriptional regulator SgrR of sgrS sRNA
VTLCHESLLRAGPDGVSPSLAARWTSQAEGREWTLELAEGLRFHDGRAVTSEDALRSLRRFLRSGSPAAALLALDLDGGADFRAGRASELPGVLAPAPNLLSLRFVEPQVSPPPALASPAAAVTGSGAEGCGPFFLAQAVRDQRAIVLAFDQHVRGRPYLDQIELTRFDDRETLRRAREGGAIDLALGEQGTGPRVGRLLLILDPGKGPFDRAQARARIAAAIDRDAFVRRYLPEGEAACGLLGEALLAPGEPCEAARARPTTPSPQASERTAVTLAVDDAVPAAASQRVVAHLLALGYLPKTQVVPADRLAQVEADARLLVWTAEVDDPLCALHELASLAHLDAAARVRDARRAPVAATRPALLAASQRAILETHTVIPLAATPVFALGSAHLMGMDVSPGGRLLLEEAWLPL